jgi:hypothetical protein
MCQTYSGGELTILASEARDSSEGFFAYDTERLSAAELPCHRASFAVHHSDDSSTLVQVQPLGTYKHGKLPENHTRGWTLQESVLSSRVVLCLENELYWQCKSHRESEIGMLLDSSTTAYGMMPLANFKSSTTPNDMWWKWIESYARRQFTYAKDRFPALIGLIDKYQKATSDIPLLGLWEKTLPGDLLWMRQHKFREMKPVSCYQPKIPSWTWLSCPGAISFDWAHEIRDGQVREITDHVNLIKFEISWEERPFLSQIESTQLVLEGPVQELFIDVPPEGKDFIPPYCNINHEVADILECKIPWKGMIQFDEGVRSQNAYMCLLARTSYYPESRVKTQTFIILECISESTKVPTFRRIGIGIYRGDEKLFHLTVKRKICIA